MNALVDNDSFFLPFFSFFGKWMQAALMWSKKYFDSNQNTPLKDVIGNFLEYIQFHKIPANVLMREVHPLGLVPYNIIMNALAYQVRLWRSNSSIPRFLIFFPFCAPGSRDLTKGLLQADPTSVDPGKLSPHRVRRQGRSMSVQSSLDPYGSNTTLSSSGSDVGSDQKQNSGSN